MIGCQLAVEQINAKGGILGRKVDLLVEDSTSGDAGTAVQKARKLIDRDKIDFLLGNVNSALAAAMANVSFEKSVFHVVPGGHTDPVTGTNCHWNVFRVCNTTQMEANAVAGTLSRRPARSGITSRPTTPSAIPCRRVWKRPAPARRQQGRRRSHPARHHRLLLLPDQGAGGEPGRHHLPHGGDDAVNSLKQAVQFGLDKKFHLAGAQQELEVLNGLPPEARVGTWVFEWYWNQPNVPHVKEFVADIRKRTGGKVPTARTWFGYASTWTCLPRGPAGQIDRRR